MKRQLALLIMIIGLGAGVSALVTGCNTTQQRQAINSLYTVGESVDAAYKSYLDGVVAGRIATNDVPQISQQYALFQSAFSLALAASTISSNAPPTPEMSNAASQLILSIQAAKRKGK